MSTQAHVPASVHGRPDPRSAGNPAEFVELLRRLRIWAGNPSLTVLAKKTGLARTTMHDALSPKRVALPALDLVRRLVTACGCSPQEVAQWDSVWRELQENQISTPVPQAAIRARTTTMVPRQLPADGYGFVGRKAELKRLDAMLHEWRTAERGAAAIAVVSGPGGVGKTALAVRWAHQVSDGFPDGQIYLNLNGYSSQPPMPPAVALASLLRALGVPGEQIPLDTEAQAGLYRTTLSDMRLLIVLDNAAEVGQIRPLLPGTPACLVLVTSRHALGGLVAREGARRLTLDRLEPADAHSLLVNSLGAERVLREEAAAAELAQLCAHLPLALRIAAANLADRPHRTIAAYAEELATGDRLAALAVDGDDETAISAAFVSSYTKLEASAQLLFRGLGLLPGGDFTPTLAAVLTRDTTDHAAGQLEALAAAHLIESVRQGRFVFHELLRLFARQLADSDDSHTADIMNEVFDWYLRSVVHAAEKIRPNRVRLTAPAAVGRTLALSFADIQAARDWLEAELANLIACIQLAARDKDSRQYAWLLTDALRGYFQLQVPRVEWHTAATTGLLAAQLACDPLAEAAMHACLGDSARYSGRWTDAAGHFEQALTRARAAGEPRWEAAILSNLGLVQHTRGQTDIAERRFIEAITAYRDIGDRSREITGMARLAMLQRDQGKLDAAAEVLEQAVDLQRSGGDRYAYADALARLGIVRRYLGRADEATACAEEALAIFQQVGDRVGIASALDDIAAALVEAGQPQLAAERAQEGLAVAQDLGDPRVDCDLLTTLAAALCLLNSPDAAEHVLEALRIAREGRHRSNEIKALTVLASIAQQEGELAEAAAYAHEAVESAQSGGLRLLESVALTRLARVHRAAGDEATAAGAEDAARGLITTGLAGHHYSA